MNPRGAVYERQGECNIIYAISHLSRSYLFAVLTHQLRIRNSSLSPCDWAITFSLLVAVSYGAMPCILRSCGSSLCKAGTALESNVAVLAAMT